LSMSPKTYDIAIVGGGFSGILAANILAEHALNVLVVDENINLGGQYLRSHPAQSGANNFVSRLKRFGLQRIKALDESRIRIMTRTEVIGITAERQLLICEAGRRLYTVKPEAVLIATGAREKFVPFKGWTLPGVISTGAVQILLKGSGVLPSEDILIGGAGIFPYAVAAEILMKKGRVRAVLDQNHLSEKLAIAGGLLLEKSKIGDGIRTMAKLILSRTPVKFGTRIIEARGEKSLEEVLTVKIDRNGRRLPGSEIAYPCDCLALGYGFVANIELAQLAGCRLEYDKNQGGWMVRVSEDLETSVSGIFAAGEITGIAGAAKSVTEGQLAALSILLRLGKISPDTFYARSARLKKARKQHLRFAGYFNAQHKIPREVLRSIADETIVCRCEDITMGAIKTAVLDGCATPDAVKKAVRAGMGICQGRTCAPIIYEVITALKGTAADHISPLSVRTPLKAVSLKALAEPISKLVKIQATSENAASGLSEL
jgi:NADPH-dependent 2,4-dienoyl-CoA reductase/sulfur reductase-like enzyme